jgi:SPP1 family predicted phage head-tail adaptor
MTCAPKQFKKARICIGDLSKKVTLQTRTLGAIAPGSAEPVETFATIKNTWAAIETVEGTKRFAGVAIDDRTPHIFWIRYNASLTIPEDGNHFMLYGSRRFRVLRVTIDMENDKYFVIQCTERGDSDEAAASA